MPPRTRKYKTKGRKNASVATVKALITKSQETKVSYLTEGYNLDITATNADKFYMFQLSPTLTEMGDYTKLDIKKIEGSIRLYTSNVRCIIFQYKEGFLLESETGNDARDFIINEVLGDGGSSTILTNPNAGTAVSNIRQDFYSHKWAKILYDKILTTNQDINGVTSYYRFNISKLLPIIKATDPNEGHINKVYIAFISCSPFTSGSSHFLLNSQCKYTV